MTSRPVSGAPIRRFLPLLGLLLGHAAAATVSVQPGSQLDVQSANPVTVDVAISGLTAGAAPSLGAFDFNLVFDTGFLSFVNVDWGSGLDVLQLGSLRSVTSSSGSVNLFEASLDTAVDLDTLQPASFLLASIHFVGVASGTSNIALTVNALGDANGAALPADVVYGAVSISPEPSSGALLALGLLGAASAKYYRRRALKGVNKA